MWGLGSVAGCAFDTTKVTLMNCAVAGRSTRTYLDEGHWDRVYNSIQPGDYVFIQFGHNDIGDIIKKKSAGSNPWNSRHQSCLPDGSNPKIQSRLLLRMVPSQIRRRCARKRRYPCSGKSNSTQPMEKRKNRTTERYIWNMDAGSGRTNRRPVYRSA